MGETGKSELGPEQKAEVIKSLEDEFSNPVPEEYLDLIGHSKLHLAPLESSRRLKHILDRPEIQEAIAGSEFIDLGCGNRASRYASEAASQFGAKRYVGIDLAIEADICVQPDDIFEGGYKLENSIGPVNVESEEKIYMQDDMLGALAKIKSEPKRKRFFLISGIQSRSKEKKYRETNQSYFDAIWKEIERISDEGSAVVIISLGEEGSDTDPASKKARPNAKKHGFGELDNKGLANFIFIKK